MEEVYSDVMDSETLYQDFDEIDLYGTRVIEEEDDDCDIEFE